MHVRPVMRARGRRDPKHAPTEQSNRKLHVRLGSVFVGFFFLRGPGGAARKSSEQNLVQKLLLETFAGKAFCRKLCLKLLLAAFSRKALPRKLRLKTFARKAFRKNFVRQLFVRTSLL